MNPQLNASTTTRPVKPVGILPPIGERRETFRRVFARAREAFPDISGMVYVDKSRAFFQISGDSTPYSVGITEVEYRTLTGSYS